MKSPNCYLFTPVILIFSFTPAWSQTELPDIQHRALIAQANPALAGIEKLYVIVEPSQAGQSKDGLVWKGLQDKIENKLKDSALKIEPGLVLGKGQRAHDIPEFRLYMELLKFADSQIYVFRIQTALAVKAQLPGRSVFFKADVWRSAPVMQAVDVPDMAKTVTAIILKQTEAFIAAWLAANPAFSRPAGANDIPAAVSERPAQKKTAPADAQQKTEYKYVASKNSRLFHRPGCSAAKRIKPGNLVGYNTRAAAVKAGKRPCRRCKP